MPVITGTYTVDDPDPIYGSEYSPAVNLGVVPNGGLSTVNMWAKNTSNVGVPTVFAQPTVVNGSSTVQSVEYKHFDAADADLGTPNITSPFTLGPNEKLTAIIKVRHASLTPGSGDEAGEVQWDVTVQTP